MRRSLRWAERCRAAAARPDQTLFAIVQGGLDPELRAESAEKLVALDFTGYAIGGLSVGESPAEMYIALDTTAPLLPRDRPRYLMGVGRPIDLLEAISRGVDLFDCVMPTRNGRNAYAFTASGPIRLRNSRFTNDPGPIEDGCDCYACRTFERGAIRHFFFAGEMLGPILLSVHNIRFYQRLMADIRLAIAEGRLGDFAARDPRASLGAAEEELRPELGNKEQET
jgi:queuine tRNA-ribosyltransferase